MRILHVLEPSTGGVATHVRDLVRAQIGDGDEVAAVVADRDGIAEHLRELGATVATAPWQPRLVAPSSDARVLNMLVRTIRTQRPELVHTHGNKGGVLGRLAARTVGTPVAHSAHGFAYLSQDVRPRRGQTARRRLTLGIERALAPLAKVIICVSDWERREALAVRVARPERLVTVHNGVSLRPASPDPSVTALRADGPLVGYLALLDITRKGPLIFLEALNRSGASGVLIGDGPDAAAVRDRAGPYPVLPFPGVAGPALAALDVYVLPSLWESLPISVLEAMAQSLPVVASDVGGVSELVVHGETGLLVRPGDPAALADAIGALIADAQLRKRMGAAGRKRCEALFSLDTMHSGIVSAYSQALGGR